MEEQRCVQFNCVPNSTTRQTRKLRMQRPQDQDGEQTLKIAIAAKQLDVSTKTIYNWIEHGYLETVSPGYVRLGDVIRAQKWAEKAKSETARTTTKSILRDRNGRFSIFKTK